MAAGDWHDEEVARQERYTRMEQESAAANRLRAQLDEAVAAQRRQHFHLLVAHCTPAAERVSAAWTVGGPEERLDHIARMAEILAIKILTLKSPE